MPNKTVIYAPRKNKAGDFSFYPTAKLKKEYPDAEVDHLGMDLQDGEAMSLNPQKTERRGGTLVVTIAEGRVELANYDKDWTETKAQPSAGVMVWDVLQMIDAWASD